MNGRRASPASWLGWALLLGRLAATCGSAPASDPAEARQDLAQALQPANNEKPFVINGTVNLACDISPANADDSVALILWYKDDSLAPIYTIDARKVSSLDKAKTSIDDAYAARASFNARSKPAQLHLEPVRIDDEGEYRCRVDFRRGRTVNTIISLRVVLLPEELRIVQPQRPQAKLEGLIGPFSEGSELVLLCLAIGGKPRPQIRWRRDFNVIDESYQHIDKEGTSNELRISSLSKNHLLSLFTCQATNNNITAPMQTSITLDLNLKPQEVHIRMLQPERPQASPDEPLLAGQTVTFECITHGSRPQATLHWLFQGSRHDPPMQVDQQQTTSRLSVTLQRSFNQQPLVCVAENPRITGPASSIRHTVKLDVHYPPQLSVRHDSSAGSATGHDTLAVGEPQQPQEGNDIYLSCSLEANPRPIKPILWRFNGRPIQALPQVAGLGQPAPMIVMSNQSLVLRKVNRNQSGSYTCEAQNQHGTNTSRPLEVDIRHAPVCVSEDVLIFQASLGQTVNIDCRVQANPSSKSVHYSWFSAPVEANLSDWLQRDVALDDQIDETRLKYRIKDEQAFAQLKCKAKNDIGIQQRPCLFRVVPAPEPSLKHTCALAGATPTSLQVSCEPSEHLKSEEFELVGAGEGAQQQMQPQRPRPSGPLNSWLDLEAIKAQSADPSKDSSTGSQLHRTRQRLVYPPAWLLAELHRWQSSTTTYELIAYVIVGSGQQLAHIKSIVEENRLFSTNPRPIYYVITKQLLPSQQKSSQQSPTAENGQTNLTRYQSDLNLVGRRALVEDPSIQLAGSFLFTIPNLEPNGQKYKLIIYGQNLASRTRDWLVVSGETKHLEASSAPDSELTSPGNSLTLAESDSEPTNHSLQQKSIVMRSQFSDQDQQQSRYQEEQQVEQAAIDRVLNLSKPGSLVERLQQLHVFKDYAISYARQRPLLAVPIALMSIMVVLFILIWTASTLVQLIRGPNRHRSTDGPSSGMDRSQTQPNKSPSSGKLLNVSQDKFLGSPDTNPDERSYSTSSSSGCVVNQHNESDAIQANNSPEMPGKSQLRSTVYTIEDSYAQALNKFQQPISNQILATALPSECHILGSLDRRLSHANQHEPIYVSDSGALCFQQGPICKVAREAARMSIQHHQYSLAGADHPHNPLLVSTPFEYQNGSRQPLTHYHHGSLSSSTCSEQASQQGRYQCAQNQYPTGGCRGRLQRVAFDLSHQERQGRRKVAGHFTDSGASNSATNTADSGLESPPTVADLNNQTNQFANPGICQAYAPRCSRGSAQALLHATDMSGLDQHGMLMLMELSPGSQESSTFIQTSVDSLSNSAAYPTIRQLHSTGQIGANFIGLPACTNHPPPGASSSNSTPHMLNEAELNSQL